MAAQEGVVLLVADEVAYLVGTYMSFPWSDILAPISKLVLAKLKMALALSTFSSGTVAESSINVGEFVELLEQLDGNGIFRPNLSLNCTIEDADEEAFDEIDVTETVSSNTDLDCQEVSAADSE